MKIDQPDTPFLFYDEQGTEVAQATGAAACLGSDSVSMFQRGGPPIPFSVPELQHRLGLVKEQQDQGPAAVPPQEAAVVAGEAAPAPVALQGSFDDKRAKFYADESNALKQQQQQARDDKPAS